MKDWTDKLVQLNACREAVEWAKGYPTLTTAWAACDRADWMLWLAGKVCRTLPQRKRLVLAACACARTALRYVKVVKSDHGRQSEWPSGGRVAIAR